MALDKSLMHNIKGSESNQTLYCAYKIYRNWYHSPKELMQIVFYLVAKKSVTPFAEWGVKK